MSSPGWDRQDMMEGKPHGWIQWKGTQVCMDVYCKCGFHGHIDDDFVYNVKCPMCGTTYMCNGHIQLVELTEDEAKQARIVKELPLDKIDGVLITSPDPSGSMSRIQTINVIRGLVSQGLVFDDACFNESHALAYDTKTIQAMQEKYVALTDGEREKIPRDGLRAFLEKKSKRR
jgi:hypothetical protein